jgi:hypothetical protein
LKKLSNDLQPYTEVVQIIDELNNAPLNGGKSVRILGHVLSYAKFQFGNSMSGKSYRERSNGDRIDNWNVEIEILCSVYLNLANLYHDDQTLGEVMRCDMIISTFKQVLEVLRPWHVLIDSMDSSRIDVLNTDQVNTVLFNSSIAERNMGDGYTRRGEFNLAENHCQRALAHAKRYKGGMKTTLMSEAYSAYSGLRTYQIDYKNAITFAEEAYNCVAEAYNPVHPKVQSAAAILIECLIHNGDWYDAERYSQVTLDSLRDPANNIDQNSEEVAHGYGNLAKAMNRMAVDFTKAEALARESYRIRLLLYGNDHQLIGISCSLLATILLSQNDLGAEHQRLHEHALAIFIRNEGPDGINTASTNANLGGLHWNRFVVAGYKGKEHLRLAKGYCKETVRIYTKMHGPTHPHAVQYSSLLSHITRALSM